MHTFLGYFYISINCTSKIYLFCSDLVFHPILCFFSGYTTIPTSQGRQLLAGGFWGLVRHPNYLGDIIALSAFLPFVARTSLAIVIVLSILYIVVRTRRDNARCKRKYGTAWDRYCQKVRYALIPKVF